MLLLVNEVQGMVSRDIIGALVARNKSADIWLDRHGQEPQVPALITDCKSMYGSLHLCHFSSHYAGDSAFQPPLMANVVVENYGIEIRLLPVTILDFPQDFGPFFFNPVHFENPRFFQMYVYYIVLD